MKTLIKNGTVVTAYNEFTSEFLIKDEKIVVIGADVSEADVVIDTTGKYVIPGEASTSIHIF